MKIKTFIVALLSLTLHLAGSGITLGQNNFAIERNGLIINVSEDGEVVMMNYSGDPSPAFRLALTGKVTGLAANDAVCIGVTDKGEIFTSRDGRSWDVTDFNKTYEGYYRKVSFVGVAAGAASVAVTGVTDTNAPAVFISTRGTVWSERPLDYFQGEEQFELTELPVGITADLKRDEFVLECTDDVFFIIPPCSHCNRLEYRGN